MYLSHLFIARSTLSSIAFSGASLGTVLSMLSRWSTSFLTLLDLYKILRLLNWGNIEDNQHHHFSGLIIQLFGWEWVFYLQGGLALLWCLLWVLLVADSPDKHRWQHLRNTLRLKSKARFWPLEVSEMKEQPEYLPFRALSSIITGDIEFVNIPRFISSEEAEYIAASQPKQVQNRLS